MHDDENMICLLTKIEINGPTSQLCFDPNNPERPTLKEADPTISLPLSQDGSPVSILYLDPKKHGIDPRPEKLDQESEEHPCIENRQKISLIDTLSMWWYNRLPYD